MLPHCTFVTPKALRHIPPNSVLARDSRYALRENLFHEALHQELAASLLHEDFLAQDYWSSDAQKVPVPWRGGAWEPDRVLHAVYVYLHLLPMRREELRRASSMEERAWLTQALDGGLGALRYLLTHLGGCKYIFSKAGVSLLEELEIEAGNVLKSMS